MTKITLVVVLLVGLIGGLVAAETGVIDQSPSADSVCNTALETDGWSADLDASKDVQNGTRLVCIHENGTEQTITANISISMGVSNE